MNEHNTTRDSFDGEQGENRQFEAQMQKVFDAFKNKPSTMLMVSIETGILRANICRYVAHWKKQKAIIPICKAICLISKHRAWYYSANKSNFSFEKKF